MFFSEYTMIKGESFQGPLAIFTVMEFLDIRFDRKTKNRLMLQGKVEGYHSFRQSGWTTFYISMENDIRKAIALLRESYEWIVCRPC
jgi:hypothetical protein